MDEREEKKHEIEEHNADNNLETQKRASPKLWIGGRGPNYISRRLASRSTKFRCHQLFALDGASRPARFNPEQCVICESHTEGIARRSRR